MNVAEFESWLNAVENVCGDYSQAEAKKILVKKFGELTGRVKTLEDALTEVRDHCYTPQDASRSRDIAKQALAAKEPKA